MTILRSALKLVGACFLTAAFVYMFMSLEAHFAKSAYSMGYTDCLFSIPGVQPEKSFDKSGST